MPVSPGKLVFILCIVTVGLLGIYNNQVEASNGWVKNSELWCIWRLGIFAEFVLTLKQVSGIIFTIWDIGIVLEDMNRIPVDFITGIHAIDITQRKQTITIWRSYVYFF